MRQLYWNTVSPILKEVLLDLMNEPFFNPFRLVGGTALSLQIGHRMSVDIDMFTDASYGSIDFDAIKSHLENKYNFCNYNKTTVNVAFGTYVEVGHSEKDFVKIDFFYTHEFIFEPIILENIRMATQNEIIAMKMDVVLRGGRKKDFWDLHYFLDIISIDEMISLFNQRYPYNDELEQIRNQITNFDNAESDFDPNCLLSKNWDEIKLDFFEVLDK